MIGYFMIELRGGVKVSKVFDFDTKFNPSRTVILFGYGSIHTFIFYPLTHTYTAFIFIHSVISICY